MDIETGIPVALGFGLSSSSSDAIKNNMNCQCALSYHESLKQGCKMQIDLGSYTDKLEEYTKDLDICVQQAYKVSAFQTQFGTQNYFKHGHSRCLPNGNYDPIQCIDRPGMEGK